MGPRGGGAAVGSARAGRRYLSMPDTPRPPHGSPNDREIPLSRPDIGELEEQWVLRALRSGRLSIGPMLEKFERMVALRVGTRHAIGVSNGTCGLHLAMLALGIGPGDEVITTPFSFIAPANSILYVGATPVFVDICPRSLNMDPAAVEAAITPRTRAILAVETFGVPTHMDAYARIAARHEIPLIEDSCEALGGSHKGRTCGSFGRVGVFGFYPNKQITTGEGGMIVTDDDRLAELCRSMRNQGRSAAPVAAPVRGQADGGNIGSWLAHPRLGFNYRLDELSAALGIAQMQRLDEMLERRRTIATMYMQRLLGHSELILPSIEAESVMSWFVFVVRLATEYTVEERDRMIAGLKSHEIGASNYFPCIHLQPFYRQRFGFREGMFPIAERVSQRTIALPFFNQITPAEIEAVASTLEVMLEREQLTRA